MLELSKQDFRIERQVISKEKALELFTKNEYKIELIKEIEGDILYLDPPYNARQYGANYHLLNTIAKYDSFSTKGKTGLRDYQKSKYCSKPEVLKTFEDKALIHHLNLIPDSQD